MITLGNTTFDHVDYDRDGDVLYLSVGEPQAAADSEETRQGHVLRFDAAGALIGLTIVNVQHLLDRDELDLAGLPVHVDRGTLEPALA